MMLYRNAVILSVLSAFYYIEISPREIPGQETGAKVAVYRFPNLMGHSRPKYNSAVSTFCWAVANVLTDPNVVNLSPNIGVRPQCWKISVNLNEL